MAYINEQNQEGKYGQLAHKLINIASVSGRKVALRRVDTAPDTATEFLHEYGTTDMAIGDVTAEVMLTTMGKIPSEMYYLEDTPFNVDSATQRLGVEKTYTLAHAVTGKTGLYEDNKESLGHSSVLIVLLTALLIILLLCCITACIVTKSRRKLNFFGKTDTECEPGCTGMNQPLLDKISSSTDKTSISSLRN